MPVETVTDATFATTVEAATLPVLADFGTEWCVPCKQLAPTLSALSDELEGRVKIVKIDIDDAPEAAMKLGVRGIPALFLFKDGQVIASRTGNAPQRTLQGWIDASIQGAT